MKTENSENGENGENVTLPDTSAENGENDTEPDTSKWRILNFKTLLHLCYPVYAVMRFMYWGFSFVIPSNDYWQSFGAYSSK